MSTEKDTYQKSGTSVVFQKEIKQCRGQRFESAITP